MPFGIGGHNQAQMRSEYHHRKFEMKQHQDELDQHHNYAKAEAEGEAHRSPFVIRVLRRLFGRF